MSSILSVQRRELAIAAYDAANPLYRYAGIIDAAVVAGTPEIDEYKATSVAGDACEPYVAFRNKRVDTMTLTLSMMSQECKNLAFALSATANTDAGATAPEYTAPTGLVIGDVIKLPYLPDPTTVVVTDSNASPATLVEGTDWKWRAKKGGMLEIIGDISGYTEPLKVNGDSVDSCRVHPFDNLDAYYCISLAGGNEANGCSGAQEEFWRAQITEEVSLALHQSAEEISPTPMELTITLDKDTTRASDPMLGFFGRMLRAA